MSLFFSLCEVIHYHSFPCSGRPGANPTAATPATPLVPTPPSARAQPNPNAGAFGGLDFAALLNQLNPQAAPQPVAQTPAPSSR
jgi:hypothetical protein